MRDLIDFLISYAILNAAILPFLVKLYGWTVAISSSIAMLTSGIILIAFGSEEKD